MKNMRAAAVASLLWVLPAAASALSPVPCSEVVSNLGCMPADVLGLSDRVDASYRALLERYRGNASALDHISKSQGSWRRYLEDQCLMERELPGDMQHIVTPSSGRRFSFECIRAILKNRLGELEAL